ncbi:MAG TPA: hypothetical protein ENN95_01050 [Deltaproteobacteria bacterium]|nr:hypothetical protein [Deltaproteobacteria bacterium]
MLIRDSGAVLPAADIENLLKQLRPNQGEKPVSVIDPGILPSLLIVNKYQAKVNIGLMPKYYFGRKLQHNISQISLSEC